MDALELIRSRRSTRAFLPRPVEREKLEQIVEAGRYAPSGGNCQSTHFLVITCPQVLANLARLVEYEFAGMEITEDMYPSLARSIRASKKGGYVFHYNPAALIITANRWDYGNSMADCACALENMMLQANALDLGSCWINQLRWLSEDPVLLQVLRNLGMENNERVFGAMALGYPATKDGLPLRTPLPRTGYPVTWIE